MSVLVSIVDDWFRKAITIYPEVTRFSMTGSGDRFQEPTAVTLRDSLTTLIGELAGDMDPAPIRSALDAVIRLRAVQDCSPDDAVRFTGQLRESIRAHRAEGIFPDLDGRISCLSETARDVYARCRQDVARVRLGEARRLRALEPWMRLSQ